MRHIVNALYIGALGALLGVLAKMADGTTVGLIGTYIGFWVLATTLVAVYSPSPRSAAVHAFVFLAAMLATYYAYSTMLFGFFPRTQFAAWGGIALLAPVGGYAVWYARGAGWLAAILAAVPIGLLMAEGYPFVYTLSVPLGFDLAAAVVLLFVVPRGWQQRWRVLPLALLLAWVMDGAGLLYLLPW